MCEREPIPVLGKDSGADDPGHVKVPSLCLKTNCAVSSSSVNYAHSNCTSKFGHGVFMPVANDFLHSLPNASNFRIHSLILLHQNHCEGDQGSLANKIGGIFEHGLKQVNRFVQTSAGAGYAKCHSSPISNVRVV